ncbi:aminopeptidase Ey [Folsomia candida]|uniref:aminopeptidase Ey n=1 Tax=Folsomia candida TaxID=158441 RepID=UPI000B9043BE|nr:aminopeptidase Ey [Folsomia candida]
MANYIIFLAVFLLASASGHPPLQIDPINPLVNDRPVINSVVVDPLHRLAKWIPIHYNVELAVVLDEKQVPADDEFTAKGKVDILFQIPLDAANLATITLHANLLSITSFSLTHEDGTDIPLGAYQNDTDITKHFVHIPLQSGTLQQGVNYTLHAESVAQIFGHKLNGLYRSNYTKPDLTLSWIAATQMESLHLRELFPCFDEPDLKATFSVQLIHQVKYTAIANGLRNGEPVPVPETPGWVKSSFNPTVPMSTYLFAITVAEFDSALADPALFGKPVRTWSTPELIARGGGQYTADLTARLLAYFDGFFNTVYPMEKMDSAAITHKGGAMENWGLILYRTDLLIYLEGETLETAKNSMASVVSHEVAHQNFGNLVTCKWWSEIWLNEGFATYVSYLGVNEVAPEFRHLEWQINDALQPALAFDAGPTTSKLRNDAVTPDEVDNAFGTITYDKGASINRMIEGFLTLGTFQKGLITYLEAMTYLGAEQDDLFTHLQAAADGDGIVLPATVKEILDSWTLQISHPLVRVSVAGDNEVFITQERYANPGPALWYVPITIVTQDDEPTLENSLPKLWLTDTQAIETYQHNVSKWIMLNQHATGFYRVLYDDVLTPLIRKQLMINHTIISPLSRSQLLDDYFNLAFRAFVDIDTALELTTYLAEEDHFTVWEVVFNQFRNLHKFISHKTDRNIFTQFLLPKVKAALNRIGLPQNDTIIGADEILRMKLIDWACSLGDEECISHAKNLSDSWENENPIHVDIQGPMFCTIVSTGGKEGFDFIWNKYFNLDILRNNALKTRLMQGLACAAEVENLQNLLNAILTQGSGIALDHRLPLIQRIAMNSIGRSLVITFLNTRLDDIISQLGGGSASVVLNILSSLSSQLSTQEELDRVLKFMADNAEKLDGLSDNEKLTVNNYINTVRTNINWMNQWGSRMISWMEINPHPEEQKDNMAPGLSPSSFVVLVVLGLAGFFRGDW